MTVRVNRNQYLAKLKNYINEPELVKIITGMRRTGKSVLLEQIQELLIADGVPEENILAYNFEDLSWREYRDSLRLHDHLRAEIAKRTGRVYLFFDELQEVEAWETCINSIRASTDTDIYVTGSNAHMLSDEFATYLAGRYIEIQMYPLSFAEFSDFAALISPDTNQEELFSSYLKIGGLPFASELSLKGSEVTQYLQDIYSSVVIKDIIQRNKIRDVVLLRKIVEYVIANTSKTFSARSISKFFKSEGRTVAPETILNYLRSCEDAFLFERINRYDVPGKRQLETNEKYYLTDHGLREALTGRNADDIELVLENIVCIELKRRGYKVFIGKVGDLEVDFIAEKADQKCYFQVCYLLESEATIDREYRALEMIEDNYPKFVISMDTIRRSRNGITNINITDFLLSNNWE